MNSNVSWFRFQIVFLAIVCLLLACWSADGHPHTKGRTQGTRLGREFQLRAGQQVTLKGQSLRIKFAAVKEDSRCPADVTCVWAGNATVRLEVSFRGRGDKSLTLSSMGNSQPADYRDYKIRLVGLSPYPLSTQKIAPGDYVVTLLVSKN